jgi:hypothetical protein
MMVIEVADEAGRTVYLAAFHAAQAILFERTGRTPKTHRGVRTQFGALARTEASIDVSLRQFLTDGYDLKTVADYGKSIRRQRYPSKTRAPRSRHRTGSSNVSPRCGVGPDHPLRRPRARVLLPRTR